jgi:hypothetical protein
MRMILPFTATNAANFAELRALGQDGIALLLLELLTGPWARTS